MKSNSIFALSLVMFALIGCSGGGGSSPQKLGEFKHYEKEVCFVNEVEVDCDTFEKKSSTASSSKKASLVVSPETDEQTASPINEEAAESHVISE